MLIKHAHINNIRLNYSACQTNIQNIYFALTISGTVVECVGTTPQESSCLINGVAAVVRDWTLTSNATREFTTCRYALIAVIQEVLILVNAIF